MRTLTDPIAVAAKAAVSVAGTLALTRVLGLHDTISATFAALVCVSPVAVTGVRLGLSQVVSSAVGGVITALLLVAFGASSPVLAAAMGLTVWTVFRAGLGSGYLFAGFTVIYVFLVPAESPAEALRQRLAALTAGMVVATLVNTIVSALIYRSIFARRITLVRAAIAEAFTVVAAGVVDPAGRARAASAFDRVFPVLWTLGSELTDAQRDGFLRRGPKPFVDAAVAEVQGLARLAHVGKELGLLVEAGADDVTATQLQGLAGSARSSGEVPEASEVPIHRRAVAALVDANGAAQRRR